MLTTLAILCAAFHIYAFILESLVWGRPRTNKIFAVNPADAKTQKLLAFNQGFYNLFLAIAIILGLVLQARGDIVRGVTLVDYGMASAIGAGLVLVISEKKLFRAATAQALPGVLYFIVRAIA